MNKMLVRKGILKNIWKIKKALSVKLSAYLVPLAGVEPARCCHRGILSPLRLPIPPHQRMGGGGFEPPKALPADLQSVPFGHSGIHPFIFVSSSTAVPNNVKLYHIFKQIASILFKIAD